MDLKEAAKLLGSTSEAIRKHAKWGTITSESGGDGRLYVWVDDRVDDGGDREDDRADPRVDALIERMASEVEHL